MMKEFIDHVSNEIDWSQRKKPEKKESIGYVNAIAGILLWFMGSTYERA